MLGEVIDTTDEDSVASTSSIFNEETVLVVNQVPKRLRQTEDIQERKEKAIKEMEFLLMNSQKYAQHFLTKLRTGNTATIKPEKMEIDDSELNELKKRHTESSRKEERHSEVELKYFVGNLHPYQKEGLKWLKLLFENAINGILADEMGLGKTIQLIALICSLFERKIPGPYLIIAPLSTLPNWVSEFKKFAPQIPVILFYGNREERYAIKRQMLRKVNVLGFETYPVIICSFLYPVNELTFFQQFRWRYIILDEGHRIKNFKCQLIRALKKLVSANRLILTGTPLQNNLLELWSLLNFLHPQIFPNAETFSSLFEVEDFQKTDKIIEQEQNTNIISTLHGVLGPFMLRRLKSEVITDMVPKKEVLVYCPLTDFQMEMYMFVLHKNVWKLTGKENPNTPEMDLTTSLIDGRKKRKCTLNKKPLREPESDDEFDCEDLLGKVPKEDKKSIIRRVNMNNPVMIMKKIVNHPFSVHCPVIPGTRQVVISEDIVTISGKMKVLDAMLKRLRLQGHKVLIFCTMTQILDFIEDYLYHLRQFPYCRLDGKCRDLKQRQHEIDLFNNDPNMFCFLISTRAGGLGINLTQADTVIFFDRDWNPQVDVQAQDRCHRIGQTKPVMVYSLISKGTIDERIVQRANAKRRLEKIVIKKGKFKNPEEMDQKVLDLQDLQDLLNSVDHNQVIHSNTAVFSEEELEDLLDRSDLYKELEDKKAQLKQ